MDNTMTGSRVWGTCNWLLAMGRVFGAYVLFLVGCLLGFVEMLVPEAKAEYAELKEDTSVGVFAIVSAAR